MVFTLFSNGTADPNQSIKQPKASLQPLKWANWQRVKSFTFVLFCQPFKNINKVTPPVKTRAVLQSGISDVLQDMWHFWMPFHECSYFILLCAWVCIMTHTHTDIYIYMCVCLWVRTISCLCAALCMSKKMTLITAALDAHHPSPQPQHMSRNASKER